MRSEGFEIRRKPKRTSLSLQDPGERLSKRMRRTRRSAGSRDEHMRFRPDLDAIENKVRCRPASDDSHDFRSRRNARTYGNEISHARLTNRPEKQQRGVEILRRHRPSP
jgi:hypothetical protein